MGMSCTAAWACRGARSGYRMLKAAFSSSAPATGPKLRFQRNIAPTQPQPLPPVGRDDVLSLLQFGAVGREPTLGSLPRDDHPHLAGLRIVPVIIHHHQAQLIHPLSQSSGFPVAEVATDHRCEVEILD